MTDVHLDKDKRLRGPDAAVHERRRAGALIGNEAFMALVEALDWLPQGIVAADGDSAVLWVNRSARSILDAGDGIRVANGRLRCTIRRDTMRLERVIALAAGGGTMVASDGAIAVLREERSPLSLVVRPAQAGHGTAVALVFVSDPDSLTDIPLELLMELYGFTRSEARLAGAFARGSNLQAYAASVGIGLGTARSQLKRAMAKTRTNRQHELVRLILSGPAGGLIYRRSA